jgi:hypothetical protein
MTPPFADAKMPEVVARVAYQLVLIEYRKHHAVERSGQQTIINTLSSIECLHGSLCHSALLAALFATRDGKRMAHWRDDAIVASRAGYGFRRCWYPEYKATRRDPRVTNRGVR